LASLRGKPCSAMGRGRPGRFGIVIRFFPDADPLGPRIRSGIDFTPANGRRPRVSCHDFPARTIGGVLPGKRRKRHAETTESSGTSRLRAPAAIRCENTLRCVVINVSRAAGPHLGLENCRVKRCPPDETLRKAQCKCRSFANSVCPYRFSSYPLRLGLTSVACPNREVCGERLSMPGAACLSVPGRCPGGKARHAPQTQPPAATRLSRRDHPWNQSFAEMIARAEVATHT
jgi:hypothetical protein